MNLSDEERQMVEEKIDELGDIISEFDSNSKKLAAIVHVIIDLCRLSGGLSLVEMTGAIEVANKYIFDTFRPGSLKRNEDGVRGILNYIS